ncbi:MAG: gp436 family protein [Sinimarinibacterium flocculans]|uniref:gp436 family protein n=1 Tax=Sinimarinibacterium flocculans TaxID=985250 RepID=UPI003C57ADFC
MGYASQDDLVARFSEQELIQLTDRDNEGAIDTDVVDRALADADELINSYLSQRYPLPLPSTPAVLTSRASDIARFRLYDDAPTEEVRKRYEEAIAWLRDVVAGKAGLGFPDSSQQPATVGGVRHGQAASGFDWSAH